MEFVRLNLAFREWMHVSPVSLDRMWPPVVKGWVWWTSKPVSNSDMAENICDAHHFPFWPCILFKFCSWWLLHVVCVVFAVGCWMQREAGVLLLFQEASGVGLAEQRGWGRESSMHGRTPLLPSERTSYCPGNLSEWLPWGPLPLSLPHRPPTHTFILSLHFTRALTQTDALSLSSLTFFTGFLDHFNALSPCK